jgi:hypothetical protein
VVRGSYQRAKDRAQLVIELLLLLIAPIAATLLH